MQARLADDPGAVTGDFLTRAGLDRPVVGDLDNAALARHLAWLADMDMRGPLAAKDCPILALCGENDAIVPAPLSAASFPADRIEWITGGDHMAPIKNADLIASRLRDLRMGRSS
jgi:pimeloyl-ACP methyl ester carboxylesterase